MSKLTLPTWISVEEYCEIRGITPQTARKERLDGRGPPFFQVGHGTRVRYKLRDVEKFMEAHSSKPRKRSPGGLSGLGA